MQPNIRYSFIPDELDVSSLPIVFIEIFGDVGNKHRGLAMYIIYYIAFASGEPSVYTPQYYIIGGVNKKDLNPL